MSKFDPLDADELRRAAEVAFDFEAELDRFADPLHEDVQRLRLRVTAPQLGHGRDEVPFRIALDEDIVRFLHYSLPGHMIAQPALIGKARGGCKVRRVVAWCRR